MKQHLLVDFVYSGLQDNDEIINVFHSALEAANAHIRGTCNYNFRPEGLTALVILGESHAAISTWPRAGIAQADYFSCSEDPNFNKFMDYFREYGFEVKRSQIIIR